MISSHKKYEDQTSFQTVGLVFFLFVLYSVQQRTRDMSCAFFSWVQQSRVSTANGPKSTNQCVPHYHRGGYFPATLYAPRSAPRSLIGHRSTFSSLLCIDFRINSPSAATREPLEVIFTEPNRSIPSPSTPFVRLRQNCRHMSMLEVRNTREYGKIRWQRNWRNRKRLLASSIIKAGRPKFGTL